MKLYRITALCTDVFGCDLEEITHTVNAETEEDALKIFNSRIKNEEIFCNVKQITSILLITL